MFIFLFRSFEAGLVESTKTNAFAKNVSIKLSYDFEIFKGMSHKLLENVWCVGIGFYKKT